MELVCSKDEFVRIGLRYCTKHVKRKVSGWVNMLKLCEKRLLRKLLRPEREENRDHCIVSRCKLCSLPEMVRVKQANRMRYRDSSCTGMMNGRDDKSTQSFVRET